MGYDTGLNNKMFNLKCCTEKKFTFIFKQHNINALTCI